MTAMRHASERVCEMAQTMMTYLLLDVRTPAPDVFEGFVTDTPNLVCCCRHNAYDFSEAVTRLTYTKVMCVELRVKGL